AEILGWSDHLGTLGTGKLADLIVVDDTTGDPFAELITARETSLTLVVIGGIPRVGQRRLMKKFSNGGMEEIKIGRSTRILDLTTQPGDFDLGVTLREAKARLADTLKNLSDRVYDLDDAIAAGWVPGVEFVAAGALAALIPPGWQEPPHRVVLEFEEEDNEEGFREALLGTDLADWVEPMELAGITVPDDPGFLKAMMEARNLPVFVKEELPGLHGVKLAVPEGAFDSANAEARLSTEIPSVTELRDFLPVEDSLTQAERLEICDQAIQLLEGYYVHLPMKRTMHAVDPIQRLRILGNELEQGRGMDLTDLEFHRELISVFDSVQNLHTTYRLPRPFRGQVAWLPFLIEECTDPKEGIKRFVVSRIVGTPGPDTFKKGVEILHWNGIPIERLVADLAQQMPGGNPAARRARAMNSLTLRSMTRGQIPAEDWVRLRYRAGRTVDHYEQPWLLFKPRMGGLSLSPEHLRRAESVGLGLDDHTDDLQHAKKALFARAKLDQEARLEKGMVPPREAADEVPTALPTVFRASRVRAGNGTLYGYIRIFTFNVADADEFVEELERLLEDLPPNGLIIDVRGNGGGLITAAERALELLSPNPIEPEPAQFINTPGTLRLCSQHKVSTRFPGLRLEPWLDSIKRSVASGATHSLGFPITDPDDCNRRGQRYQGPKALIVDGLCYSATDMFIAGFKDHRIGKILGTHSNTGAGGANVWSHRLLRYLSAEGPEAVNLRRLPKGADLRVAVRRTLRVGPNAGELVEDFGIIPDEEHAMTRKDVEGKNEDLISKAIEILRGMESHRVTVGSDKKVMRIEAPGAHSVQLAEGRWPVGAFPLDESVP
ncbi:MAG: S41 family peptidase, partial [Acidobacteriota bacterium]